MKAKIAAGVVAAGLTIATALVIKWEPPADPGRMLVAIRPIPTDPWTICYGHTKGVYAGMTATMAQCEQWLREDLGEAAESVHRCIRADLTPGQFGAFTDAAFNAGPSVVCGSTLQRKANAGDLQGACAELARWVHAGGKRWRGLELRRADARAVCWPDFSNVIGGST